MEGVRSGWKPRMRTRDIIVISGSAGAFKALMANASGLPKDLPAAVFLVLHTRHTPVPALTMTMSHVSPLPVSWAVDGEPIERAHVYLAPGGQNLLIERGDDEADPDVAATTGGRSRGPPDERRRQRGRQDGQPGKHDDDVAVVGVDPEDDRREPEHEACA